MPKQMVGYYISRSDELLKDFERTVALMNGTLVSRYGETFTRELQKIAHKEYESLIPDIPFITGLRAKVLNSFLLITAQELAAYKAMNKLGKTAEEAWELCHQALRLRLKMIPWWKRWLIRKLMFSKLARLILSRRARRQQKGRFGEFEIEYLSDTGRDFDLGINYLQCGNLRFAIEHEGEAFAPYICMSDIALSDAMGWGLTRTQTLADGCDHCDFRMKEGAVTQISSKTPEVQKTVERIRNKESKRQLDQES